MLVLFITLITMGIVIDVAMSIRSNKAKPAPRRPWLSPDHPDYEMQVLMGKDLYWEEINLEL